MRLGLAAAIVAGLAAAAAAEPAIVLVETRDAPPLPALQSQVELHVSERAAVRTLAAPDADPLTFAARATQLVAAGDASLVVWIGAVDHGYLVFAAGPWPDRALIELVRIDDTVAPSEIERTIALKVAGLLDTLLRPQLDAAAAIGVAAPAPPPQVPPTRPRTWRIEVAALVAYDAHQRAADGRTAIAVGRSWRVAGWTLTPGISAYWQPSGTIDGDVGRASLTELGAAVGCEVGRVVGPLELAVRPRIVLGAVLATGESTDGRRGEATVWAPYVGVGLAVRRAISESAAVGVEVGGDLALVHHELVIDGEPVVDLGRGRLDVGLSLTVAL